MKYTDEELVAMTQQYSQAVNGEYVTHIAYKEINRQVVEENRQWCKCANCGNPYPLSDGWGDMTVCGEDCWNDYATYLQSETFCHWSTADEDDYY